MLQSQRVLLRDLLCPSTWHEKKKYIVYNIYYISYIIIYKIWNIIRSINVCWINTLTNMFNNRSCSLSRPLGHGQHFWHSMMVLKPSPPFAFLLVFWGCPQTPLLNSPSISRGRALYYLEVHGSLNSLKIGSAQSGSGWREAANSSIQWRECLQETRNTLLSFTLCWEGRSSSAWGFSKPFRVISGMTQYLPFREAPWRLTTG